MSDKNNPLLPGPARRAYATWWGSELEEEAGVDLSAREVVGHGILVVGDVGHPIVGVDVADAQEVEAVEAEPDVAEDALALAAFVVEHAVAHADVGTLVGRRAEGVGLQFAVGRREGQSVGVGELEAHLPPCGAGEEVGEIEVEGVALVGGHGHADAVEFHLRVHDRERDPRVAARHKLAEELEVEAGGVSGGEVVAVVDHLDVVDGVGHEVSEQFVVELGGELEGPVVDVEAVVHTGNEV